MSAARPTPAAPRPRRNVGGRLTKFDVASLIDSHAVGMHADGANLYLQVTPAGSASWVFRFGAGGRQHKMGLGSARIVPLTQARKLAAAHKLALIVGEKNPLIARREEKAAQVAELATNSKSFDWCAEQYIAEQKPGWKSDKHAAQWESTLATYAAPHIGKKAVDAITTEDILQLLRDKQLWTTKNETASRVRNRVELVLGWATVQGWRKGDNPARWKGHLDNVLPPPSKVQKTEHHAALPYRQLGAFLTVLREKQGLAARALELLTLTATRTSEVIEAKWDEFDLAHKRWTIPKERMKAEREHVVPLSAQAVRLLKSLGKPVAGEYVFPGQTAGQPLSNMAMLTMLKKMGRADFTPHGMRSTFRDWGGEVSNFPREVLEHALAHRLADKAEAAYQRGTLLEKRAQLMAAWANYCDIVQAEKAGNVMPIAGHAKA